MKQPKVKLLDEFRTFAIKGNVVDMAVGIIIGAAFGKIVSSLVSDVIMPPLGLLIGGVDFTNLSITLKAADLATSTPAVLLKYGNFIQTLFDFTIVAFAVFLLIKMVNRLRAIDEQKTAKATTPTSPKAPEESKEEKLLAEIRDLLKNK